MKTNFFWILLLGAIVIISVIAALLLRQVPAGHARIYKNNVLTEAVNLAAVTEPFTITIDNGSGMNMIAVEYGRIRMMQADCPDESCVHQGWMSSGVIPVVCLPNKVVITFSSDSSDADIDAVVG